MNTPGPYEATVLADSIADGVRLTTLCCTFPRIVLAEFNTHRMLSRNSASSRAIPVERRIAQVRENPYVPLSFGANQRGMQASRDEVQDTDQARAEWLHARDAAVRHALELSRLGLHKQWANRVIEPFTWHTVIVSATEWANFFAQRIHEDAQPEIRKVAEAMKAAMDASTPFPASAGLWHLPLVGPEDGNDVGVLVKLSVARCAAISYERHMLQDIDADLARYGKLRGSGHMSPLEHAAVVGKLTRSLGCVETRRPLDDRPGLTSVWSGPFIGNFAAPWIQHRKLIPGEAVFGSAS